MGKRKSIKLGKNKKFGGIWKSCFDKFNMKESNLVLLIIRLSRSRRIFTKEIRC